MTTCENGHTLMETVFRFFGTMAASSTHEIKNTLAIINENAGLLEDLSLMAEKGVALSPERLRRMSSVIQKQVQRADTIIKHLNRFSHNTDYFTTTVNIPELLAFIAAFADRLIERRGVTLEMPAEVSPVTIATNPLYLLNLIWCCLDCTMEAAGKNSRIKLDVETADGHAHIQFKWATTGQTDALAVFPSERERALLEILHGRITTSASAGEMMLSVPDQTDGKHV